MIDNMSKSLCTSILDARTWFCPVSFPPTCDGEHEEGKEGAVRCGRGVRGTKGWVVALFRATKVPDHEVVLTQHRPVPTHLRLFARGSSSPPVVVTQ